MCSFRKLKADEIDVRIAQVKPKDEKVQLLLYKNARVDMDILDETVGSMNWQRKHSRDNANCAVGIYDEKKGEWVWKEDTGTESNTEAEKGLASDSFKRACFNWGIGRELYTAPQIWVLCEFKDGKPYYPYWYVEKIEYTGNVISKLEIKQKQRDRKDKLAFSMGYDQENENIPKKNDVPFPEVKSTPRDKIISTILGGNKDYIERLRTKMTELYARRKFEELNDLQFKKITELATEFAEKKGL